MISSETVMLSRTVFLNCLRLITFMSWVLLTMWFFCCCFVLPLLGNSCFLLSVHYINSNVKISIYLTYSLVRWELKYGLPHLLIKGIESKFKIYFGVSNLSYCFVPRDWDYLTTDFWMIEMQPRFACINTMVSLFGE